MEADPPGSPCRRGAQTAAVSCRSRAGVGSDCGKGLQSAGQVRDEKTSMCEPLQTHRQIERWHQNRGRVELPGQRRAHRGASSARGRPACCPGGVRCIGGVSSSQALARNRRTCRLDADDQCGGAVGPPVVEREDPERQHRKGQSTDARHRDGPARSSDEGAVMALERRGRAGQVTQMPTRCLGRS